MSAKTYRTLIEVAELARMLDGPDLAIVDCRWNLAKPGWGAAAYAEAHIPGAVFASMDEHLAGSVTPGTGRHPLPAVDRFAQTLSGWGIDERVQVVAYDQDNGAPAARLWWLLRWLGHFDVAVLNGGFAAWRAARMTVSNAPGIRKSRQFVPHVKSDAVVTSADVQCALGTDAMFVVDARAADRFAGRNETIDPVAGHVPGAINHPFARNLEPNARFMPPDELRARWQKTLQASGGVVAPDRVVAMCGSGVTACHNLLALEVAGLHGARLYAGSWSEWIRDPARPVATEPDSR